MRRHTSFGLSFGLKIRINELGWKFEGKTASMFGELCVYELKIVETSTGLLVVDLMTQISPRKAVLMWKLVNLLQDLIFQPKNLFLCSLIVLDLSLSCLIFIFCLYKL